MATYRFYIPAADWNPESLALSEEEAHHCHDVMRCREGDRIVVFDGEGNESESEITSSSKKRVELKPLLISKTERPPAQLTLGQAIPKGKNMDLIIQKATELGASRVIPLLSERTVVQIDKDDLEKKRLKWQRVAIEACKQCGRCRLLEITAPGTLQSIVSLAPPARRLLADPAGLPLAAAATPTGGDLLVAVGPEGGFTTEEVAAAEAAGFRRVSLGPHILRIETAAIAMAAAYRLT